MEGVFNTANTENFYAVLEQLKGIHECLSHAYIALEEQSRLMNELLEVWRDK
jgi:hypothetical protein